MLELRDLERSTINLVPKNVMMESDTELTQYIITRWSLNYKSGEKNFFLSFNSIIQNVFISDEDPDAGIELEIVMKRRIVNELLTTYLPTVFILCIVYATNFFKPFFFEAVVTVNLTSQLVLTTLFISVSNSLPPTAYVKMIDVWLIFSQLIPFVSVLLHTFMDNMRQEGERKVNNHGKVRIIKSNTINVVEADDSTDVSNPQYLDMTQRNEESLVQARKAFYEQANVQENLLHYGEFAGTNCLMKWYKINFEFTAKKGIPIVILAFSTVYWAYGLYFFLT